MQIWLVETQGFDYYSLLFALGNKMHITRSVSPRALESLIPDGVVMLLGPHTCLSSPPGLRLRGEGSSDTKNWIPAFAEMTKNRGFSLIELAIVLVILGLLVGGIIVGQSLIRAAELRNVTTEFQGYRAAVSTFRDKYFAVPGDMPDATDFWGAAHASLATCKTTAGTGTQTCNGNGDGFVGFSPVFFEWYETYLLWEHLANAELIEGTYTGIISGGGSFHVNIGTNIPRSRISNAGWTLQSAGINADWWSTLNRDHMFQLGAPTSSGGSDVWNNGVILKPDEAWSIDTKIDDGKPGIGTVMNFPTNSPCNTTNVAETAAYNLTNSSVVCAPMFKAGF